MEPPNRAPAWRTRPARGAPAADQSSGNSADNEPWAAARAAAAALGVVNTRFDGSGWFRGRDDNSRR